MKGAERKRAATILFAALTIIVALFVFAPRPAPIDRNLHAQIGEALAKEAASLLKPGGKVTVITRDTSAFSQPALDILLKNFTREIGKRATITTLPIAIDPLRPASVPAGDFFELLRRSKAEDVVVSLLGPPILSDQQRFVLGGVRPRVIALCNGAMSANLDLRRLFDAGLLHAAVVSRQFPPAVTDSQRRAPTDFASLYQTWSSNDLAKMTPPMTAALDQ